MSTLHMLRVDQRLTAAVEEIFVVLERTIAEYEAELSTTKEENYQLLDAVFKKHQVVLHRTDVQQPPHIKEEEEDPQPTHMKEEEEDPHMKEEEEDDVSKFPLTVVSVKTEEHEDKAPESSQLHHSPRTWSWDLQSEAENEELPEKRNRKPVHRLGDSDDSEEDPGNGDLASLGLASQLHRQTSPSRRVPARVMSTCQLDSSTGDNFLAPHHGEGRIHMPSPAPALNMQRVTQGTAIPPRLPPPPSPAALNMWQTEEEWPTTFPALVL
ncbi:uncharacterized protein LOC133658708 isoform X2 [Entelurus aequoreus]|uniref:uncharacterized protein LOC133658708 isoform X2 n=1 Tax=Entelurus aequoreus TaxID=161455 RepID=UPI002B1DBCB5|nr:uncharacterized protein LOC133658708 isoform X2 [Entelurus aequoreus]